MPVSFTSIVVGSKWSRPALSEKWGYAAYQALARGVVTPAEDNKIILFVTEEKQVSLTNYKDVLEGNVLKWEGPNDHFGQDRIINAQNCGDEIHLFHRPRHHMDFEYCGLLKLSSTDLRIHEPSKFVFEILAPLRKHSGRDKG